MLNIRRIQNEADIQAARQCVPEGCAEPEWAQSLLIERDGKVVGVCGAQLRYVLEPMYFKESDPAALLLAIGHMDGFFRGMGVKQYEFFIQDRFEKFQQLVEKHFPVVSGRENPGKTFFRKVE